MSEHTGLYREINEAHEFRGEGYFKALADVGQQTWLDASPPRFKFAIYPNDEMILKAVENDEFVIVGGKVDDGRWGIPHNDPVIEYRVHRRHLKDITPRLELK